MQTWSLLVTLLESLRSQSAYTAKITRPSRQQNVTTKISPGIFHHKALNATRYMNNYYSTSSPFVITYHLHIYNLCGTHTLKSSVFLIIKVEKFFSSKEGILILKPMIKIQKNPYISCNNFYLIQDYLLWALPGYN